MKRFIHCILTLTIIAFCFSIPSSLAEGILADGWADHSVEELQTAKEMLDARIEELKAIQEQQDQKSDSTEETNSTEEADPMVLFERDGVRITWKGLVDTETSGLDFQPDIYFENMSKETLSVSPSGFYVNGYLMNVSNSGSITLEPETRLMLSTKYSWLLSAEDLIDVYGMSTIEKFSVSLTVKLGEKYLAEKKKVSIETNIDIFEMMGKNSYFNRKYPEGFVPTAFDPDALQPLFKNESVRVLWKGLVDTETSGLDFQPDIYFENMSKETLSVSPSSFYVNGCLMNASNSGSITLEPETRLMLSTKYSWLLSAEDLIDKYGVNTIENFSMSLTVKLGDKYLAENKKVTVDTNIDIYEMMGGNSYFTRKYTQNTEE